MPNKRRFTDDQLKQALDLSDSNAHAAHVLGVTPAAVGQRMKKLGMETPLKNPQDPRRQHVWEDAPTTPRKIIAWDIETLPMLAAVWHTGEQRIHSNQIVESTSIACASWQDIAQDDITSVSLLDDPKRFKRDPYDDISLVKKIHAMLMNVGECGDILLHQNGDRFDLKKVKARMIFHSLDPLPPIQTIDTLKASRLIGGFDSYRLDYMDKKIIGGPGKIDTRGMDMWTEACAPKSPHSMRVKAMQELVHYNRGDLPPLIREYQRFLPYMSRHPNRAIGIGECCPRCGGKARTHVGYHDKITRRYPTYRCHSCRGIYEGTFSVARAWFRPV
ncbi:MAG: hypothetical protein UY48_C0053G0012 [Candidatus Gottesmanbacteria bacterium GW2011_GWB1_49_7]|uniref:Uncharacterized protein n=1 Tax=Candidatus Gottesmanbacteria bacterium GW2011_GWB1_49_7 TaxID=1618448 RepID=A0A0G1VU38_9BACT|nr:MAG: hypothetical protein UY48_C0053G0012 [Candidatus Gottesmanbacteria bacterium GW2011_GWB1_49_7]